MNRCDSELLSARGSEKRRSELQRLSAFPTVI